MYKTCIFLFGLVKVNPKYQQLHLEIYYSWYPTTVHSIAVQISNHKSSWVKHSLPPLSGFPNTGRGDRDAFETDSESVDMYEWNCPILVTHNNQVGSDLVIVACSDIHCMLTLCYHAGRMRQNHRPLTSALSDPQCS